MVELLVVIAIIALLISMLMPSLQRARRAAYTTMCLSNIRQIALAATQYVQDNHGWLLDMCQYEDKSSWVVGTQFSNVHNGQPSSLWYDVIYRYLGKSIAVLECPEQTAERGPGPQNALLLQPAGRPQGPVPQYPDPSNGMDAAYNTGAPVPQRRQYLPGYFENAAVHTWGPTIQPNGRYAQLMYRDFKRPTEKIWYGDGGMLWDGINNRISESWRPQTSRGLKDGLTSGAFGGQLSGRHGTLSTPRGNVAYFDGHAATIDCTSVLCVEALYAAPSAADRAKWGAAYDADGDGFYQTPAR